MEAIIWTKDGCGYCVRAKALLEQKNIPYVERKIGAGWTREQLLESVPSARTVPQIFIDGLLIGGHDELKAKIDGGQL